MDRFDTLEAFVRVVESGSFSAAARELRLGQPALSKAIARLEQRLGVRLLLRSTRGLSPTEAGHSYYEHAKRVLAEIEEADVAARGAGAGFQGRLRVAAPIAFARLVLVPRLPAFLARHPDLSIELAMDDRHVDLVESGADLAIRIGPLAGATLTARKLANGRRLVVGTPAFFARHGEPATPRDLAAFEAVTSPLGPGGGTWTFRKDGAEVHVALAGRLTVTAAEGVRAAVLAEIGLAVASDWLFARELASGAVRAVLTDWDLGPVDLWAAFPSGRRATAKARAFADFVAAILRPPG